MNPRLSVVIATFNRPASLRRLLLQLAGQTMPPQEFEVVVVDDGSRVPVQEVTLSYRCTFLRQENQGAAVALHRGATAALGEVLLIIDDDMQVPPALLSEHARLHENHQRAVVLGRIKSPFGVATMPLFERFHSRYFEELAQEVQSGKRTLRGIDVWTGNLSLRRAQYLKVGGFDAAFKLSHDAELGLRLEKDGAAFHLSENAYSIQHSDHTSLAGWMDRSYRYGKADLRISRKHPEMPHASPWRDAKNLGAVSRALLGIALAAPAAGHLIARAMMLLAGSLDHLGMERAALAATGIAFGMEYTRGLHDEVGGTLAAVRDIRRFSQGRSSELTTPLYRDVGSAGPE